jgi:HSP20 family protein
MLADALQYNGGHMAQSDIEVRKAPSPPAPARATGGDLFQSFRNEVDRLFDQFWRETGSGLPSLRRMFESESFRREPVSGFATPMVDVSEDDKAFHITADLPGLTEKDINVTLSGDTLTIGGERREEREQQDRNYHFSERRFGSFRRAFSLPAGVDHDKIEANFKNGVLAVTLPKTQAAMQQQKKIEVKAQ